MLTISSPPRRALRLITLALAGVLLTGTSMFIAHAPEARAEEQNNDFVAAAEHVGPIGTVRSTRLSSNIMRIAAPGPFADAALNDGLRFLVSRPDGSGLYELANVTSYQDAKRALTYTPTLNNLLFNTHWGPSGLANEPELVLYIVLVKGGVTESSIAPLKAGDKYLASRVVSHPAEQSPGSGVFNMFIWSIPTKTTLEYSIDGSSVKLTTNSGTPDVFPSGKVQFTRDDQPIDGALYDVVDGVAEHVVPGLEPGTYNFGAIFTPTDSSTAYHSDPQQATYAISSDSKTVVVNKGGGENPGGSTGGTSNTDIDFVLAPLDPGAKGLVLETAPAPKIVLNSAGDRAVDGSWSATGKLGAVTVNDDRRKVTNNAWSLQAKLESFKAGKNEIPASALSWTPSKTSGPGTVDNTKVDLSATRVLAGGTASDTERQRTLVDADLELKLPAGNTYEGGNYSAKLTLTLF